MRQLLLSLLLIIGFSLIVVGAAKISPAIGFIVAGVVLILIVLTQGAQIMREGRQ